MTTTGSDLVSHIRSILDKKDKDADHINLSEFLQRLSKQPRNTLCFVFEAVALSRNKDALDALLRVLNGKLPTAPIQQKIHLAASDLHQVGMGIKQAEKELEKESVEKGKKAKKRGLNNGKRAATLSLPSDYPVGSPTGSKRARLDSGDGEESDGSSTTDGSDNGSAGDSAVSAVFETGGDVWNHDVDVDLDDATTEEARSLSMVLGAIQESSIVPESQFEIEDYVNAGAIETDDPQSINPSNNEDADVGVSERVGEEDLVTSDLVVGDEGGEIVEGESNGATVIEMGNQETQVEGEEMALEGEALDSVEDAGGEGFCGVIAKTTGKPCKIKVNAEGKCRKHG